MSPAWRLWLFAGPSRASRSPLSGPWCAASLPRVVLFFPLVVKAVSVNELLFTCQQSPFVFVAGDLFSFLQEAPKSFVLFLMDIAPNSERLPFSGVFPDPVL